MHTYTVYLYVYVFVKDSSLIYSLYKIFIELSFLIETQK